MSLLARLEAEAEHLYQLLDHMANFQRINYGGVQSKTQALLDDVKAHMDATRAPDADPMVLTIYGPEGATVNSPIEPAPAPAPVDPVPAPTPDVVPAAPAAVQEPAALPAATDTTAPAAVQEPAATGTTAPAA